MSAQLPPAHETSTPPPIPAPRPRILILDEDRIFTRSLSQLFRRAESGRYDVFTTDNPTQALELIDARQCQILLADLPRTSTQTEDPHEFLRQLKRQFPHLVTVILTAFGSIEAAVRATKAGAFDYLTKPVEDDEILSVIARAVRHQALLAGDVPTASTTIGPTPLTGHDARMLKILDLAQTVANSRTTLLMTGESGTGKSLLARSIHQRSARAAKPFIEVSCGSLSETLLESELFGHVKGAFTNATSDKPGRFLAADGGTLFLDEINSASPAMQVKLLRVLQERCFEPVGSSTTRTVDVRVILATNVDLSGLVAEQKFRQDLYYRINVVNIQLPPLRDRRTDIPLLATSFLRRFAKEMNREILGFTEAALTALTRYAWPGNVRELENAVEHATLLSRRPTIDLEDLPETLHGGQPADAVSAPLQFTTPMPLEKALEAPERAIIEQALHRNGWNRQNTAAELNINRTTLYKKMRKYHLGTDENRSSAA